MSEIGQATPSEILAILQRHPTGLARGQVLENLNTPLHEKTLQRRLAELVEQGLVYKTGDKKAARYFPADNIQYPNDVCKEDKTTVIFSSKSILALRFLDTPPFSREKVSYNRSFLDSYTPNASCYVPKQIRKKLHQEGRRFDTALAAGTYARQICQRLLIDLSYNSSRLEGNTYSRLDTQKLVEEGITPEGKIQEETVMIMNHKEAILFLVENSTDIALNSLTIRNLHHLLSQDLLANPQSCGNIRSIEVDIAKSTYKPLSNSHLLNELFELTLLKANQIIDPFEQSFFLLVHLSYLQAFEDVNKRTARLGCNIPFIRENLCPLSFVDVPRDDYIASLLTIYEKNNIGPLLDLFVWSYQRSCNQYNQVKSSIGEIDAFRILYRQQRKDVMGLIIRKGLQAESSTALIKDFCQENGINDIARFTAMTLADLSVLHSGAIIGLGITENQFKQWEKKKR